MNTLFLGILPIPIYFIALSFISLDKEYEKRAAKTLSIIITLFLLFCLTFFLQVDVFDKKPFGGFLFRNFNSYSLNKNFIKYFILGLFCGGVITLLANRLIVLFNMTGKSSKHKKQGQKLVLSWLDWIDPIIFLITLLMILNGKEISTFSITILIISGLYVFIRFRHYGGNNTLE